MAISFKDLKKKHTSVDELKKKHQEESQGQNFKDERQWYPERDKETGNASALIRYLPAIHTELPWVKLFSHGFKGDTGKWFIENCPTTLGRDCPVCEANSELWNTGDESNKNIARKRKRQVNYYSNIYVIQDPQTPENNNQVFIFRYGSQIHDMLMQAMDPQFEDDPVINPFSVFEDGANLNLRIIKKNGQTNYDEKSKFSDKDVLGTEEEIEDIINKAYDLNEFVAEDKFKSYDELKKQFLRVIGENPREEDQSSNKNRTEERQDLPSSEEEDLPFDPNDGMEDQQNPEEDDDDFEMFKKLANEDD